MRHCVVIDKSPLLTKHYSYANETEIEFVVHEKNNTHNFVRKQHLFCGELLTLNPFPNNKF